MNKLILLLVYTQLFFLNSLAQEPTSSEIIKELILVNNFISENRLEIEKLTKIYATDIRTMETEIKRRLEQYRNEASSKSDYINQERMREIQSMQNSIEEYNNQTYLELLKKHNKLLDDITEWLNLFYNKDIYIDSTLDTDNYSKSYIGYIIKTVIFREGPGDEYNIIKSMVAGNQIFVISKKLFNDYYNVIDIESNLEGFVHKSFVKLGDEVSVDDEGVLTPIGESGFSQAGVEIFNNTNKKLTIKLNNNYYDFLPKETKTIYIKPGKYNCRASAPGVLPYISVENLEGYTNYSWKFFIENK